MFQSFEETSNPAAGPARLTALRAVMLKEGFDAFIVPRSDAHQGEYVAPRDDRLAWLTGFTGSAGFAVILADRAGVFVDSRYRVQVKAQIASDFTPVDWPEISLSGWIAEHLTGGVVAYDPWLFSVDQLRKLMKDLPEHEFRATDNLIDRIWDDQPDAPIGQITAQPVEFAGEAHDDKLKRIGASLKAAKACVLTLPDSIAWLLNIRGTDIPRNPVPHAFAILKNSGNITLFVDDRKLGDLTTALGPKVTIAAPDTLITTMAGTEGPVQIDPATCPVAISSVLAASGIATTEAPDPCLLPKACKNPTEIASTRAAHARDGAAMVRFLAWLDQQPAGSLTEIDVVKQLEGERRATNCLEDISFDTISGTGPNGAIVHYRVTEKTNARIEDGHMLLVDSGGQYRDGTTDITRTIAIGTVGDAEKQAFTRVLRGMIAISRLKFPKGLAGRDLDAFARAPLWEAGLDYGHGTGHGVGAFLSVHEGPQRLARTGTVPFEAGMILSNEPGFYREGAFGIRIENLIVVTQAEPQPDATIRDLLEFETLTYVPIDRRLIVAEMLTAPERAWLNSYHETCRNTLLPLIDDTAAQWLVNATQPI
jgi:Xaa-Pro aminopeptidase